MPGQVSLQVNDTPVELVEFVQGFFYHTIGGMLSTLEGAGEIKNLVLTVAGNEVTINLNNTVVPTNPFVTTVVKNTILGMVSSLKGVGEIDKVHITISK